MPERLGLVIVGCALTLCGIAAIYGFLAGETACKNVVSLISKASCIKDATLDLIQEDNATR